MSFRSQQFQHGQAPRIGILLTNLGTPAAATPSALRAYLREFLSDPRVIEVPKLLWWLILHLVILRIRPPRSAKAYAKVWTAEGSPLAVHTEQQALALQQRLKQMYGEQIVVSWAMRYGQPDIQSATQKLLDSGVDQLLVLPLYPQYSATTTASTFDALSQDFTRRRWLPQLRFISGYHKHPAYISAVADSIRQHQNTHGQQEHLLFSYHGLPMRYLHKGDPYHCFCLETTRLIAQELGLAEGSYSTSFQSRFGREPWLQPYTDVVLTQMGRDKLASVAVVCPGFSADCLETIEEIDEENRDFFIAAGGGEFHYIPALNSSETHIDALAKICTDNLGAWLSTPVRESSEAGLCQERYNAHPFNKQK